MPAELYDVVDEDDRVLFRASRERVHREYQIHRTVVFFVFDAEGNVFVNQRSDRKEIYPGYWSIAFGGHVLAGESYDNAVVREIREETGLRAKPSLIGSYKKRNADERENVKVYAVTADAELTLFADEIEQGRFMTLAEINQMLGRFDFLPETDQLLRMLVEHTSRRTASSR
ncbi:MAG: NUDIX domain-containing protein [Chloroflexi bacterium]|nr:NUDIX domain-containing protein [Chloroflexota bacterium]